MNAIRKAGILATFIGLLAVGAFELDSDANARSPRATPDIGLECGSACFADIARFATPVGDGLVVLNLF